LWIRIESVEPVAGEDSQTTYKVVAIVTLSERSGTGSTYPFSSVFSYRNHRSSQPSLLGTEMSPTSMSWRFS
jgi:hypothetical protein